MKKKRQANRKAMANLRRGTLFRTVKPLSHESVTSWLQRFGRLHGVTPAEVLAQAIGIEERLADIDLELTAKESGYLMHFAHMGKDSFQLNDVLFRPLRRQVIFPPRDKNICQWIVQRPNGVNPHFAFCPICLREDEIPYWRVEWRFRHWMVCPDHRCWLQDTCSHCGKRQDLGAPYLVRHAKRRRNVARPATLAQCMKCGKNLYGAEVIKPEPPEAEYYVCRQRALLSTLINEHCILHPATKKWPVETALKLLRQKKLHPVGVDFLPEPPAEEGLRILLAKLRFDFHEHSRRSNSHGFSAYE